jgi:hypothetical protein
MALCYGLNGRHADDDKGQQHAGVLRTCASRCVDIFSSTQGVLQWCVRGSSKRDAARKHARAADDDDKGHNVQLRWCWFMLVSLCYVFRGGMYQAAAGACLVPLSC